MTDEKSHLHGSMPATDSTPRWTVARPVSENIFGAAKVSNPLDLNNVSVVDEVGNVRPANSGLSEAEVSKNIEIPELSKTSEEDMIALLTPVKDRAQKEADRLRVSNPQSSLLQKYDHVVEFVGGWQREAEARRQQEEEMRKQEEARAQELIMEAQALLTSATSDADFDSIYAKLDAIAQKLGKSVDALLSTASSEIRDRLSHKKE